MPYTPPGHRRSSSSTNVTFSNDRGPGAFAPLSSVPRRSSSTPRALFHLRDDNTDDDNSDDNDDHETRHDDLASFNYTTNPPLKLKPNNSFRMSLQLDDSPPVFRPRNHYSPFKSTPPQPQPTVVSSPPIQSTTTTPRPISTSHSSSSATLAPPRPPAVTRTSSTPIFLSNGKPLKSSLKSSSSSPNIPNLPKSSVIPQMPSNWTRAMIHRHARARSAPSTPGPEVMAVGEATERHTSGHTGGHHVQISSESSTATHSTTSSSLTTPVHEDYPEHDDEFFPLTPKNVHFAENDGLASVKVFNRSARPASLKNKEGGTGSGLSGAEDTETETEGELSASGGSGGWMKWGWGVGGASSSSSTTRVGSVNVKTTPTPTPPRGSGGYPFPRISPATTTSATSLDTNTTPFPSATAKMSKSRVVHTIDAANSSIIPSKAFPPPSANIHLESIVLLSSSPSPSSTSTSTSTTPSPSTLTLSGTLLVRNLSYEKNVAVRFTLDDWQTVSEVSAKYVGCCVGGGLDGGFAKRYYGQSTSSSSTSSSSTTLSTPSHPSSSHYPTTHSSEPYDRFGFSIRLEDYEKTLGDRKMFLVAKYATGAGGEWWDNNEGGNYWLRFVRTMVSVEGDGVKEGVGERKEEVKEDGNKKTISGGGGGAGNGLGALSVPTRRRVVVSAPPVPNGDIAMGVSPPFSSSPGASASGMRAMAMAMEYSRSHPPLPSPSPHAQTQPHPWMSSNPGFAGYGYVNAYSNADANTSSSGSGSGSGLWQAEMEKEKSRVVKEKLNKLSLRNYVAPNSSTTATTSTTTTATATATTLTTSPFSASFVPRRTTTLALTASKDEMEMEMQKEEVEVQAQAPTPPDTPPRGSSPTLPPLPRPSTASPPSPSTTSSPSHINTHSNTPKLQAPQPTTTPSNLASSLAMGGIPFPMKRTPLSSPNGSRTGSPVLVSYSSTSGNAGSGLGTRRYANANANTNSNNNAVNNVHGSGTGTGILTPNASGVSLSSMGSAGKASSSSGIGTPPPSMSRASVPRMIPTSISRPSSSSMKTPTLAPLDVGLSTSPPFSAQGGSWAGFVKPHNVNNKGIVRKVEDDDEEDEEEEEELITPVLTSTSTSTIARTPTSASRPPTYTTAFAINSPTSTNAPVSLNSPRLNQTSPPTQYSPSLTTTANSNANADDATGEKIRGGLNKISTSGSDDELYKAFVRQWCFAGGAGTPTGAVVG